MDFSKEIKNLQSQLELALKRIAALENANKKETTTSSSSSQSYENKSTKPFDNNIYLETKDNFHYISGNTYNFRSLLKENKASWDGDTKSWKIKNEKLTLEKIYELIKSQGSPVEYKDSNKTKSSVKKTQQTKVKKSSLEKLEKLENVEKEMSGFSFLPDSDSD